MKKALLLITVLFAGILAKAQFGFVNKTDLESFKESQMIVVLFNDSAYNASIQKAVEKYWNFNGGFLFVSDTMLKQYKNKNNYTYLVFSKSKTTKMKAKVCSSQEDMNGLVVSKKFNRKITPDIQIAGSYCSNKVDTADWYPELVRSVQMLNNFFNLALVAGSDREISYSYMTSNYPTDKSPLTRVKLYIDPKQTDLKPKEDIATLWGGEVEEVADQDEIYKLILEQDPNAMYYFQVTDEKYCNKLFVTAAGSELMYFSSSNADKCKCTSKDLKGLKALRAKAEKSEE